MIIPNIWVRGPFLENVFCFWWVLSIYSSLKMTNFNLGSFSTLKPTMFRRVYTNDSSMKHQRNIDFSGISTLKNINVCIEIINVASMSHRCLFNEQTCFYDEISDSSMVSMCSGLGSWNYKVVLKKKLRWTAEPRCLPNKLLSF